MVDSDSSTDQPKNGQLILWHLAFIYQTSQGARRAEALAYATDAATAKSMVNAQFAGAVQRFEGVFHYTLPRVIVLFDTPAMM